MRPIKFRAYDRIDERIYYDVIPFGEFVVLKYSQAGYEMLDIEIEDYDLIYSEDFSDYEIMQYTGLKDKNGLEVYFNDVVEDEYGHRYEVVFEGDCLRCNGIRKIRGGHKPKNRWFGIDLEIIGNRFENPKLLEEEE